MSLSQDVQETLQDFGGEKAVKKPAKKKAVAKKVAMAKPAEETKRGPGRPPGSKNRLPRTPAPFDPSRLTAAELLAAVRFWEEMKKA